MKTDADTKHRIFGMTFSSIYVLYLNKIERKDRTKDELDQVILWLTGYTQELLDNQIEKQVTFETFFDEAVQFNPRAELIKGSICGVKLDEIENPLMKKIRYLDKIVDELAKGRALEKVLR